MTGDFLLDFLLLLLFFAVLFWFDGTIGSADNGLVIVFAGETVWIGLFPVPVCFLLLDLMLFDLVNVIVLGITLHNDLKCGKKYHNFSRKILSFFHQSQKLHFS